MKKPKNQRKNGLKMPETEKIYTFSEAIKLLEESPAKEICKRIIELSKEQRELYKRLEELIPMGDGYVYGECASGFVRPWSYNN
jgi:hypothetical protein